MTVAIPGGLWQAQPTLCAYASALGEQLGARLLVMHADPFIPPTNFSANTTGRVVQQSGCLVLTVNDSASRALTCVARADE